MANQITPLSYANTFGDWVVTTNQVLAETNDIGANNYTKNTGTFIVNSSGTGLQVANNVIIQGQLQVTGTGSSAVVQNDLTVSSGVLRAANTTFNPSGSLGLRVDGAANVANLFVTGTGVDAKGLALVVSNSATVGANVRIADGLIVGGNTRVANLISNTWVTHRLRDIYIR